MNISGKPEKKRYHKPRYTAKIIIPDFIGFVKEFQGGLHILKKFIKRSIPVCHPVFCRHCGRPITDDEFALKYGKTVLCDTCISEITIEELIRICEIRSIAELLTELGFKRI